MKLFSFSSRMRRLRPRLPNAFPIKIDPIPPFQSRQLGQRFLEGSQPNLHYIFVNDFWRWDCQSLILRYRERFSKISAACQIEWTEGEWWPKLKEKIKFLIERENSNAYSAIVLRFPDLIAKGIGFLLSSPEILNTLQNKHQNNFILPLFPESWRVPEYLEC
jgi:hypothetical protein